MNERISDLLDRASDDGGSPLCFSGADVVQRARAERRRRRGFGAAAVGLAAAGVAGILVATQLLSSPAATGPGPAVQSSVTPSAPPSTSGTDLTPQEQGVVAACARVHLAPVVVRAPDGEGGPLPKVGSTIRGPVPGPRAAFLTTWTLDAFVRDGLGLTATFVDPTHTRWASCDVAAGGTRDADGVVKRGLLPTGPVPPSWFGPRGFLHQATSPSWSQVCTPQEGQICARELFAGAFARYAGVAAARVDAPDGTVLTPVFGTYTYVFRHVEGRVDPHRASNDNQPLPSMPVTLLDDRGRTIIRYDYYPSYVVPAGCPTTGGC